MEAVQRWETLEQNITDIRTESPCWLAIHGHFYQPPREDPFTGRIPREPSAAPYGNWNERITAECYEPNLRAGNFQRISFNLGGTLAHWLDDHANPTYQGIVATERAYRQAHGVGNGLAQAVHHTILPLARRRDKICQVRWGIASFVHRFGHRPAGMWLPEMAVDYETLQVLASEGIRFTILSDEQVYGDLDAGGGPYRVVLPDSQEIAVFVRDRRLSNHLSFGMPDSGHVDEWLERHMGWRCQRGGLHLVATDGETFGHHHRQGVEVLNQILTSGRRYGYEVTMLDLYLKQHPPENPIRVVENTAWSCAHGLARFLVGCDCTPGDSRWKGAFRRALDNLACDLDRVYEIEAHRVGFDPWPLRDRYIDVIMGKVAGTAFLNGNGLGQLTSAEAERLLFLLEAQFHRQRMFISCTFFFGELDRYEPRYAIANAVRALAHTRKATGDDLAHGFRRDLSGAVSPSTNLTGADIFDDIVSKAELEATAGPPVCSRPQR